MKSCSRKIVMTALMIGSLIAVATYRAPLRATLFGHYRPEGYNFFAHLHEFNSRLETCMTILPDSLKAAFIAQEIDLGKIAINLSLIIWGQLIEPTLAPVDRVYNVVFHSDVLSWRGKNDDFTINLLVGLFNPNGVAAAEPAIPIDHLSLLNVNKHDGIFYSPNNGRFQFQPNRHIVTFWTAGVSEDKTKATITFSIIVDEPTYHTEISKIINNAQSQDTDIRDIIILDSLETFAVNITNGDDQAALIGALETLRACM